MRESLRMAVVLVLISALTLLTMLTVIAPVFAKTSKKIPVTVTRTGASFTLGTDFWTTEGNTYHSRGSLYSFSSYKVTGPGANLVGSSQSIVNQNLDNNTHIGNQHYDTTITFQDGTFEGVTNTKGTYRDYLSKTYPGMLAPLDVETKSVCHGTGAFQGWTLVVESGFVNAVAIPATGYLLIPNAD